MPDISRERAPRRRVVGAVWGAALLLVTTLGLCQLRSAAPQVERDSLYVATVRRGPMLVEVRGAGTLVAEDAEWIPATTDGRVDRITVQPGADVTPETLLLELSNLEVARAARDAELQVLAAEADLRSRRLQIRSAILAQEAVVAAAMVEHAEARDRARADAELAEAGLTSTLTLQASRGREQQTGVRAAVEEKRLALAQESESTDLAAAESRLSQFRAAMNLRNQQLRALRVVAGRSGVVQVVAVEVGARVNAGSNLVRIASRDALKAVVQVSQVDASQIAPGQRARIDTHQGIVEGTVTRIDPAVQNGSVKVDVRLPRELPRGVRTDLSVDAAIEIDRVDNAIYVSRPVQAAPDTSITLFRLSRDGKEAARVAVRVGRTSYNAIEIVEGLDAGDRVILSDTSKFDAFQRITITD